MSNKAFNEDGVQWAFDATTLTVASGCMFKYGMEIVQGYRSKNRSGHLIFGGAFASALEYFYLKTEGEYEDRLRATVQYAMNLLWDREANAPVDFQIKSKTRLTLLRALVQYLDKYEQTEGELTTFTLSNGKPAVEVSFLYDVGEFYLAGHLDRIVNLNGRHFWIDQKTTSGTPTDYFFNYYNPAQQTYLYTWIGPHFLDVELEGGIIDAVGVHPGHTEFERRVMYIDKLLLEEWFEDTHVLVSNIQTANRTGHYPRNFNHCTKYGKCPFFDYCNGSPALRQQELKDNFVQRPGWDPVSRTTSEDF